MSSSVAVALRQALAQAAVELRLRLRSPATAIALLLVLALGWWWIPSPDGRAVSLSWQSAGGEVQTPELTAATLGVAGAFLGSFLLMIPAFYMVAGTIRRDRDSGLGGLLASTPIGKGAYLAGKWLGHCAYLGLVLACAAPLNLFHFALHGKGAFDAATLLLPILLFPAPAVPFVAALALAFDATPGLRSRGGLVVAFFALSLLFAVVPMASSGGIDRAAAKWRGGELPAFDPAGLGTLRELLVRALPEGVHSLSTGHIIHSTPPRRVAWAGLRWDSSVALRRAASLLWSLPLLFWATALFDRFAPRRPARARAEIAAEVRGEAPAPAQPYTSLPPGSVRPSWLRTVVAEAELVARSSRLALLVAVVAALFAAVLPAEGAHLAAAAALLALAIALSEVGARERLAGTLPFVLAAPGAPASSGPWKAAASFLVALSVFLPVLVRHAFAPLALVAVALGLLFLAVAAVAASRLSGGGRPLIGAYLPLAYAASSGLAPADFTGLVTGSVSLLRTTAWLGGALLLLALAELANLRPQRG